MDLSKYRCVICQHSGLQAYTTFWRCDGCGHQYPCVKGIPRLYVESRLGQQDRRLRDHLYDGFLGSYYRQAMPFLSLPVRPVRMSWRGWLVYWFIVVALASLGILLLTLPFRASLRNPTVVLPVLLMSLAVLFVLLRQRPWFYLLVLALPVKLSILLKRFRPVQTFAEIHAEALQPFLQRNEKLQVLDIATGTCNSLYRHGWMQLNAEYTGLDLSETMLLQGQKFMKENQVPMDFILADAGQLPFEPETFDIVLNYGAVNGFTYPKLALEEMARVAKKGGLVFFLDEQLYEGASFVERLYFKKVLSSHNTIHRCPVESVPASLGNPRVHQVYEFYYICTCHKL